jgi:hypothetical protein
VVLNDFEPRWPSAGEPLGRTDWARMTSIEASLMRSSMGVS